MVGLVTTVAGIPNTAGSAGGSIASGLPTFNGPRDVAYTTSNAKWLLVADSGNRVIRTIDLTAGNIYLVAKFIPAETIRLVNSFYNMRTWHASGFVSVLAGDGQDNYVDGVGTMASFSSPVGLAITSSGTAYVADRTNHVIRKVDVIAGE